mgnify:CR=1 FL=1
MRKEKGIVFAGIDVGSTTTKTVVMDGNTHTVLYSDYRRHQADQIKSVQDILWKLQGKFPKHQIYLSMTGSGAKILADAVGVPYIQEVVANSVALREKYDNVNTAIELGGQDAKIIFFRENESTHQLETSDMRMNGSCAGGTGAFLDEIASVLSMPVEKLNEAAAHGTCVYDLSLIHI